jgi:uncharacterized protein (DUF58 family)
LSASTAAAPVRDAAAPHPSQGSAIPEELVHELRYLEIYTRREIENLRIGAYVSPFRGVGFDFWEHRRYAIGDDVRRIDWNATARLGQILMKIDHADRELNAVLAVDLSRSMEFTSSALTKRETLLRVAGSLAFSAAADHVHLGMLAFTDRVEAYYRRGRAASRHGASSSTSGPRARRRTVPTWAWPCGRSRSTSGRRPSSSC